MRIKRTGVGIMTVGAAMMGLTAAAGTAVAAPRVPGQEPIVFTLPSQVSAGQAGYCPDIDVQVSMVSSAAARGPIPVSAGPGATTLTNLTSTPQKSITYNTSGPGTVTSDSDSVSYDVHGTNLFWTPVGTSYPGVPQIAYTSGHLTLTYEGSLDNPVPGPTTAYHLDGKSTDVCAALK